MRKRYASVIGVNQGTVWIISHEAIFPVYSKLGAKDLA